MPPLNGLAPFDLYAQENTWLEYWGNNGVYTFIQLKPHTQPDAFNKKINGFIAEKSGIPELLSRSFAYPLERWHLYGSFDAQGQEQEGNVKYVRLFSIIAWVILLIACINFMNLSTARSEKRAKEVGIRKVVGAQKQTLKFQFILEAVCMAVLAAFLGLCMVWLSLGAFNQLMGKQLSMGMDQIQHWIALLVLVLFTGLLAGSYPAFYLSAFNPIRVMKGQTRSGGSATWIRKVLVVTQFSASIILIICTLVIYQQIHHAKGRDLGYQRSHIITTAYQGDMMGHFPVLKEALERDPAVEQVGITNSSVLGIYSNTSGITWKGKDVNKELLISLVEVDAGYIPTLGMEMEQGRNFRENMLGDSSSVIINESLAKLIHPEGRVVGQLLEMGEDHRTIIGVVKDFVYNDMYGSSEPLVMYPMEREEPGLVYIRLNAQMPIASSLEKVHTIIETHNPAFPFENGFLDTQFDQMFEMESLIQKLVSVFGILSILISCLGLFGLASYTVERRAKEFGVRKVLGASVPNLANLVSKEFILLVLISCLIAFPIAGSVMENWLEKYGYRIHLQIWVFASAGLGALCIALITVSTQAFRAATANPVDSLKDE